MFRLDYQPLFGKMSPHSSPLSFGEDQDRTRETAEIEPTKCLAKTLPTKVVPCSKMGADERSLKVTSPGRL